MPDPGLDASCEQLILFHCCEWICMYVCIIISVRYTEGVPENLGTLLQTTLFQVCR